MNRRDRAFMVVTEIEALAEANPGGLTRGHIEGAVQRNAQGERDAARLENEVLRLLDEQGYDVDAPIRLWAWGLAGAAGLGLWLGLVELLRSVI